MKISPGHYLLIFYAISVLVPSVVYAIDHSRLQPDIQEGGQPVVVIDTNDSSWEPAKNEITVADASEPVTGKVATEGILALDESVNIALQNNPGLAEMQARAEAMAAIPSQAGTLPDPRISFNAMNLPVDSFDIAQEPMTQMQFGISQDIPFPGKLTLREEAAGYEAEAAMNNVDEARLQLVRNVKITWWQIFNLDQSLNIVTRNRDLLRQFVEIAQTKYKVGQGLQQDVLLARLELSKLIDLDLRLKGARRNEASRLNALMNISPDHTVHLPPKVDENLPVLANEQTLYTLADQSRPLLAKQQNHIQAAQSRVELAEKDFYPDFHAGAVYGFRSGSNVDGSSRPDMASFMLSMNMPIFTGRKQSKAFDQRRSELLEQKFKLQDIRSMVQADISTAVSDYRRSRDQVELFGTGIIPEAQQTVSSMLTGYQVNKVDFLNLVRAQVTLYNYEISYWQMLSEANQALAKVIATVGMEKIYE